MHSAVYTALKAAMPQGYSVLEKPDHPLMLDGADVLVAGDRGGLCVIRPRRGEPPHLLQARLLACQMFYPSYWTQLYASRRGEQMEGFDVCVPQDAPDLGVAAINIMRAPPQPRPPVSRLGAWSSTSELAGNLFAASAWSRQSLPGGGQLDLDAARALVVPGGHRIMELDLGQRPACRQLWLELVAGLGGGPDPDNYPVLLVRNWGDDYLTSMPSVFAGVGTLLVSADNPAQLMAALDRVANPPLQAEIEDAEDDDLEDGPPPVR